MTENARSEHREVQSPSVKCALDDLGTQHAINKMHLTAWIRFTKWTAGCALPLAAYFATGVQFLSLLVIISGFIWLGSMMALINFYFWILKIKKILSIYPWEYRAPVQKSPRPDRRKSVSIVVRLGEQGNRLTPEMVARNPLSTTRWDKEMESGVWFAGDLPFGGVIAKPGGEEPMFMQPRTWDEMSSERELANSSRVDLAQRAHIYKPAF